MKRFKVKEWLISLRTALRSLTNRIFSKDKKQNLKTLNLSSEGLLPTKSIDRHRNRILSRARKYKSSIIDTHQKLIVISLFIILALILAFGGLMYWRLYKLQDYSSFSYNLTKILPLPVAKVGNTFVEYEDYLRELKRQIYYFETHYQLDFSDEQANDFITLAELKNQAMQKVITNTYIDQLAQRYNLEITQAEIDQQLNLLRSQGRLGSNLEDLQDVVYNFWGITFEEYRQTVADNLLRQKVIKHMDEVLENKAYERMTEIETKLQTNQSFTELASQLSEDISTARNGGVYNFNFTKDTQEEHPLVVEAVFKTEIGEVSEIIDTGRRLEIIKVISDEGDGIRRAAHISIYYLPLSEILTDIHAKQPVNIYIDDVSYALLASD